jgi:hypothetical protein
MLVFFLLLFFFGVLAALSMTGRPIAMPDWITERVETRLNENVGQGAVRLGGIDLEVDKRGVPRIKLRNVSLRDQTGLGVAAVNEVGARLSVASLIEGKVRASVLRVSGAQLTVRRARDGQFSLSFGGGGTQADDLAGVLDQIDQVFATKPLNDVTRVEASDLTITLEDARSGRLWQATDGTLRLVNSEDAVSITVVSEVFNGTDDLAGVQMSFRSTKGSTRASFGARLGDAPASDIALQAPALSYLSVLDAPISGSLRAEIDETGTVETVAATLEIGKGALRPTEATKPIAFDQGRAYFSFDPASQKITFSEVSVEADALGVTTEGHAYLRELEDGWPSALVGQLRLTALDIRPDGIFEKNLEFSGGRADFRLRLDPFTLDLGHVHLSEAERTISASGRVSAEAEGWQVAMDATVDQLDRDRLQDLWPVAFVPKTRGWLDENYLSGAVRNLRAALRLNPGEALQYGLNFDFADAVVKVMRTMPPIEAGVGHMALGEDRLTIVLNEGQMAAGDGTDVNVAGSSFTIPDVNRKPAEAEILVRTDAPISSTLTLMNNPPFRVLEKAKRPATLADGHARMEANVALELVRDLPMEKVDYAVRGVLSNVMSDTLVPGRKLTSQALDVAIDPVGIAISGPGALDGVPIDAVWQQDFGPDVATSTVEGSVELSQGFVDAFRIGLPDGWVTGKSRASVSIELPRDAPPSFRLTSDLLGLGLRIPAIGYRKSESSDGALTVEGQFGTPAKIDRIAIDAPGFEADGTIDLTDAGGFGAARLSNVKISNWLNSAVTLTGRGAGRPPAISVDGGTIDVRRAPFGSAGGGGGGGPITLALDGLRISDSIALQPFQGEISTNGGLNGTFVARVNGGSQVQGTLVPSTNGAAIRVRGNDAGAAMRNAGVMKSLESGSLDLILTPRAGNGGYDGQMRIRQARLRDQPILADLLDAISVVGILDQLEGPGILFETIDARFRVTSRQVVLQQGAAVGASLGVSLDGVYDLQNDQMNMQGVVSPIYLLNGIGQIFTRRGEGLFGFSFKMTGAGDNPRVRVNPLSILTPGMFREIFRRPPPKLPQ